MPCVKTKAIQLLFYGFYGTIYNDVGSLCLPADVYERFNRMATKRRVRKKEQQVINIEKAREEKREKREKRAKAKTKTSKHRRIYAAVLIVLVVLVSLYAAQVISLHTSKKEAAASRDAAIEEKAKLERELEIVNDSEYIEHQARTRLRMIKPGEILYILPENKSSEPAITTPEISAPEKTDDKKAGEVDGGSDD